MKRTVLMQAVEQNLVAEGLMAPNGIGKLTEKQLVEVVKYSTRLRSKEETLAKRFFDIMRELDMESEYFSIRRHKTGYPYCTYCRQFVLDEKNLPVTHTNLCFITRMRQLMKDLDK